MQPFQLISVFTSEESRWKGRPVSEALIQSLVDLKVTGRCFVTRGTGGSYENGEISSQQLEVLSYRMPVKIEIVAPVSAMEILLPMITEIVTDGVVTVRNLDIVSYKTRKTFLPRHILVRQIMTPSPRKAFLETPVSQVVEWLLSAVFTGVPVVDSDNRPRGIITQTDLIYRAGMPVRMGLLAESDRNHRQSVLRNLSHKRAEEIMTAPVVSIAGDRGITDAVELMLQRHVKRLPVVDSEGKLIGMVSRLDIFRSIMHTSPDWKSFGKQDIQIENVQFVSDIMRRDSYAVSPETPVEDVLQMIDANDIQRVAVVDASGRFLGLIFDSEILAVFSREDPEGIWSYLSSRIPFTERGRRHRDLKQLLRARTAKEIMNTNVVSIPETAPIDDAVRIMVDKGYKRLPVLDRKGRFQGMISRDSLLRTGFAGEKDPERKPI